ncbi:Acid phosphatase 1 [Vitis vinifera]|uniref:Acid phosphatase 1 n=1 Tax=Vitis vinifera TaxID=29760 RepID=A0A438EWA2_VITVI|nr:Acid phosphatase 1 [Vitis vinifera]
MGVLVQLLFLLASTVELSPGISLEIHLLRPQLGSSGHHVPGLSCLSWRLGVETHNIIEWSTVPQVCESYVGHYMLGDQYRKDSGAVVYEAISHAQSLKLAGDGKDIWVEAYNSTQFNNWIYEGKAPPLPESLKLYKKLQSLGIKPVFITGRPEAQRNVTAANLQNAGYHTWEKLILKGSSVTGTAVAYKSNERKKLEQSGYRIVGNIGDQWSDILGTNVGNRTFKLPDPMYYIS